MSEVKYTKNETKDEEPLVMDNSVINALSYFKIFKCSKNFLKNLMPRARQIVRISIIRNGVIP